MNRKQWILPILAIMAFGVTGCAGNNRAGVNERYNDNARPIGYYSNENHPNQSNALFTDNDGPITEMMDHTFGAENRMAQNNYSGHLNQRNTDYSTDLNTLGKSSDHIRSSAAKVKNVKDVRSVVNGSSVLITVQLIDKSQAEKTKQAIVKAIQPYVNGKSVTVITDKGTLSKDQDINNNLRMGGSK